VTTATLNFFDIHMMIHEETKSVLLEREMVGNIGYLSEEELPDWQAGGRESYKLTHGKLLGFMSRLRETTLKPLLKDIKENFPRLYNGLWWTEVGVDIVGAIWGFFSQAGGDIVDIVLGFKDLAKGEYISGLLGIIAAIPGAGILFSAIRLIRKFGGPKGLQMALGTSARMMKGAPARVLYEFSVKMANDFRHVKKSSEASADQFADLMNEIGDPGNLTKLFDDIKALPPAAREAIRRKVPDGSFPRRWLDRLLEAVGLGRKGEVMKNEIEHLELAMQKAMIEAARTMANWYWNLINFIGGVSNIIVWIFDFISKGIKDESIEDVDVESWLETADEVLRELLEGEDYKIPKGHEDETYYAQAKALPQTAYDYGQRLVGYQRPAGCPDIAAARKKGDKYVPFEGLDMADMDAVTKKIVDCFNYGSAPGTAITLGQILAANGVNMDRLVSGSVSERNKERETWRSRVEHGSIKIPE